MGSHDASPLTSAFLDAVINATRMFGVPVERDGLAGEMRLNEIPGWDSLNRVTFTISLETAYGLAGGRLRLQDDMSLAELAKHLASPIQ